MPHHLLLADDSVTIQRVIKLTFADEDVDVVTVGNGDEAVAAIDKAPPDIVLADVAMPGRTGYDVAQYIRDTPRLAHIPVVLLTGAFEPVDEARASRVGCDAVLAKPFEPEVVVSRVRELLSRPRATAAPAAEPPAPARPAAPAPVGPAAAPVAVVAPVPSVPRPVEVPAAPPVQMLPRPAPQPSAVAPVPHVAAAVRAVAAPPAPVDSTAVAVAAVAPAAVASAVPSTTPAQSKRNVPADIDAYFDRLDEAFASLATAPRPVSPTPAAAPEARPSPPLSLVPPFAAAKTASTPPVPPSMPAGASEPAVRSLVEAFEGLLGPQESPVAAASPPSAAWPVAGAMPPSAALGALSEAQMSQIVDRVIERLTERLGGRDLSDVVANVAERLVREEIAQIKKRL